MSKVEIQKKTRSRLQLGIAAGAMILVVAAGGLYVLRGRIPEHYKNYFKSTSRLIAEARSVYIQGDWEGASRKARELLRQRGDNPEILRLLARSSARLGRDSTATAIYSERLRPEDWEAEDYLLIGQSVARAGKLDSALELFKKGEARGPASAELLDHLARLSARQQRLDEAAEAASRLGKQPGWEARGLLLLGEIRFLVDDFEGAAQALGKGLELDPSAAGAAFSPRHFQKLLARCELRMGKAGEALVHLEAMRQADGLSGVDPELEWLFSRAYLQLGRIPQAAAALAASGSYRADHPREPEPGPYTGESRCMSCHAAIAKAHSTSRHAHTFFHGPDLLTLPLPDKPLVDPDNPQVTHTIERKGQRLEVDTKVGDKVYHAVIQYAFGHPSRYVSMVGRDEGGRYRALRLSYYHRPDGSGWGRTAGDIPDPDALENLKGEPVEVRDLVVRCLYCHTTDARAFRDPPPGAGFDAVQHDSSIGCERCHGPGGNHLAAVKAGLADRMIVNVGAAHPEAATAQCAQCHIVGIRSEIEANPEDPRYVRSTAVTLALSRCFIESQGAMSCLTCHDPHRDDDHTPGVQEAKCLACHRGGSESPARAAADAGVVQARVCQVNPRRDCLSCHMPKVPVPVLRTSLTDHYIRIRARKDAR